MNKIMRDSGIQWVGEIPINWKVYPAGRLFFEIKEKNRNNLPYIPLSFRYGEIVDKNKRSISDENDEDLSAYTIVYPGVIMLNGLNLNYDFISQRVALVKREGIITSAYLAVATNSDYIDPQYATYLLKSYDYKMVFHGIGSGIRKTLKFSDFKSISIPLPEQEEQKRIVAYLDRKVEHLNSLVDEAKASIEEYKAWKASIIYEAVTKGLDKEVEMKDSGVEWIGNIPAHWNRIKSGRIIASTQNGITRRDLEKSDGQIVLKLKNISADGNIDYSEPNRIELTENEINSYRLCNDDLLFVRVNGSRQLVGKCAVFHDVGEIVAYNDHIIRTRLSKDYNVRFMQYYLLSPAGKREIELHTSTSAGQFTISGEGLRDLCITYPPVQEQCEIVQYLDMKCGDIDFLITEKESLISDLEDYKKSMIFETVTGKRKVV